MSRGIQLPLEIFKTHNGRGWGVRCSEDIAIGTFVCDYVGKLITDPQAVRAIPFPVWQMTVQLPCSNRGAAPGQPYCSPD